MKEEEVLYHQSGNTITCIIWCKNNTTLQFLNKNFIGLLFTQYFSEDKTVTMYFVKDEYRREGIASMMIEFCKSKNITIGTGVYGIDGSELFFKAHNINFVKL